MVETGPLKGSGGHKPSPRHWGQPLSRRRYDVTLTAETLIRIQPPARTVQVLLYFVSLFDITPGGRKKTAKQAKQKKEPQQKQASQFVIPSLSPIVTRAAGKVGQPVASPDDTVNQKPSASGQVASSEAATLVNALESRWDEHFFSHGDSSSDWIISGFGFN